MFDAKRLAIGKFPCCNVRIINKSRFLLNLFIQMVFICTLYSKQVLTTSGGKFMALLIHFRICHLDVSNYRNYQAQSTSISHDSKSRSKTLCIVSGMIATLPDKLYEING